MLIAAGDRGGDVLQSMLAEPDLLEANIADPEAVCRPARPGWPRRRRMIEQLSAIALDALVNNRRIRPRRLDWLPRRIDAQRH